MTTLVLFTAGTPGGAWVPYAVELLAASSLGKRLDCAVHSAARPHTSPPHAPARAGASHKPAALADLAPSEPDAPAWAGVDGDGCWSLDTLAAQFAQAQFLVVVEHPAIGLAAAFSADEALDPLSWLACWSAGAQHLLRHVQHDPSRSLLVDAEDLRQEPAHVAVLCASRFGLAWQLPPDARPQAGVDPLGLALAQALTQADAKALPLFAELQASCAVLGQGSAEPSPLLQRMDAAAASRRLLELRRADAAAAAQSASSVQQQRRIEALEAQLARLQGVASDRDAQALVASGLQAEVHRLQEAQDSSSAKARHELADARARAEAALSRLKAVQAELDTLRLAMEAAQTDLDASLQDRELLSLQVAQLHEELTQRQLQTEQRTDELTELNAAVESQTRLSANLQSKLLRVTQDREMAVLQAEQRHAELGAVRRDLQAARAELGAARQDAAAAHLDRDALRSTLHATQQGSEAARRERDALRLAEPSLLQRVREARQDAEAWQRRHQQLVTALAAGTPFAHRDLLVMAGMMVTSERNVPPFRDIGFLLRQVGFGDRQLAQATVRLVEHHGHPGIALFDSAACQLLASWQESGREGDRPYALLVPGDANSQARFDAMDSVDWHLLQALVAGLKAELQRPRNDVHAPASWLHLAQRLQERLQALPSRWRHGGVRADLPTQAPGAVRYEFTQVQWATRYLPRLTLYWWPQGPQAGLVFQPKPAEGLQPWPAQDGGTPDDRALVPLGPDVDATVKHRFWQALDAGDRDFLLAMLTAWPDIVAAAGPELPQDQPLSQAQLAAAATPLLADAQASIGLPAKVQRSLLRRVVRRLQQAATAA